MKESKNGEIKITVSGGSYADQYYLVNNLNPMAFIAGYDFGFPRDHKKIYKLFFEKNKGKPLKKFSIYWSRGMTKAELGFQFMIFPPFKNTKTKKVKKTKTNSRSR